MITVQVVGDQEIIAKFVGMSAPVKAVLAAKMRALALQLQGRIKSQKLSGQVLKRRTGALSRSIQQEVITSGDSVYGRVFSAGDVKYARIQEFGGTAPPHVIEAKNGKALAFMVGGSQVIVRKVNHPGSKIPARSYMRSSLREMAVQIEREMKDAVIQGVRERMAA